MDYRLVPLAFGAWLATAGAIVVATRLSVVSVAVWLCALVLAAKVGGRRCALDSVTIALFVVGAVLGSILAVVRVWPVTSGPIYAGAQHSVVVRGTATVISDPVVTRRANHLDWATTQSARVTLQLHDVVIHGRSMHSQVSVVAWASAPDVITRVQALQLGMSVNVCGRLRPGIAGRPEAASLVLLEAPLVIKSSPRYQWFAQRLRTGLNDSLSGYPEAARGLVPGLALGDSSHLSSELSSEMKAAGLTHLIAVSGTNVTLLVIVTMSLLRRTRLKFFAQFVIVSCILLAFVIVVRPQPSVLRAVVMGVIALSATFIHARRSAIPLLSSAVLVLLVIDPWLAVSYGFALSVAATAGLLLWGSRATNVMDRVFPRTIPQWLIDTLAVTLCAQLAVFPLLVALGSTVSLASIPANMVAVPLAGPAMVMGILTALVAFVSPFGAHYVGGIPALAALSIAHTAHYAAAMTWLNIPWPAGVSGVCLALAGVVACVSTVVKWSGFTLEQKCIMATTSVTMMALLWVRPSAEVVAWPPADWVMVACDVGQGDGAVLNVGDHQGIVIDVGPDAAVMDRCLRQLRITSIPLVILTHFHADHVGGLEAVFRDRRVGEVRVTALADPPATTQFVMSVLRAHHKGARVMSYPEHLVVGDVELECVWPQKLITGQGSDPNNASVVLLVHSHNTSILLTGDIEPAVQEAVMKSVTLGPVDVVKVPHHGSANQLPQFARWVGARQALISVGAHNDYGHPAAETVLLYGWPGATVWRTDRSGDLAVVHSGESTRVVAHGSSPVHGIVVLWQRTLQLIQHR